MQHLRENSFEMKRILNASENERINLPTVMAEWLFTSELSSLKESEMSKYMLFKLFSFVFYHFFLCVFHLLFKCYRRHVVYHDVTRDSATCSLTLRHHVGLFETYRYKRTGQIFIWNYIGNWYVFSKYLDNYCRYQYCANDTLFWNIYTILRSIFQDILPKKDVAFCETTDTAHSYIKQIVNFSEINVSIDA